MQNQHLIGTENEHHWTQGMTMEQMHIRKRECEKRDGCQVQQKAFIILEGKFKYTTQLN